MGNKKDIAMMEDIHLLVDTFYEKARVDLLLGPIFNGVIKDRWSEHLERMYRFWQTVLLSEHTYYGSPFPPHAQLPVEQQHFDTWIKLYHENIYNHFEGAKADEAKWRGIRWLSCSFPKLNIIATIQQRH